MKVGDIAPDFVLQAHDDTQVRLSDFRGKKKKMLLFSFIQKMTHLAERCKFAGSATVIQHFKILIQRFWCEC